MRLAVVGSRNFTDYETAKVILDELQKDIGFTRIVSGGANGADSLAEKYAWDNDIELAVFVPDWSIGKQAGFIRNVEIWDNADYGVAFWDGKSHGTKHSFTLAKKQNKRLFVFNNLLNDFYEI
jgi:hypothetical protein